MKRKFCFINKNKGFTLIEVIVSVAILSIVLYAAYSLNTVGGKVYKQGSNKSEIQSNLMIESNFITKELRYASEVKILKPTETPAIGKKYISLVGTIIKYYDGTSLKNIPGNSNKMDSDLNFIWKDGKTISFNVTGQIESQTYRIDSSLSLLNNETLDGNPPSGITVEYKPGVEKPLAVNEPTTTPGPSPTGGATPVPTTGAATPTPIPIPYLASLKIYSNGSITTLSPVFSSVKYTYSVNVQKDKNVTITSTSNDGSLMRIEVNGVLVDTISNGESCAFWAAKSAGSSKVITIYVPGSGSNQNIYSITCNSN